VSLGEYVSTFGMIIMSLSSGPGSRGKYVGKRACVVQVFLVQVADGQRRW
jgi:hypothetical protein